MPDPFDNIWGKLDSVYEPFSLQHYPLINRGRPKLSRWRRLVRWVISTFSAYPPPPVEQENPEGRASYEVRYGVRMVDGASESVCASCGWTIPIFCRELHERRDGKDSLAEYADESQCDAVVRLQRMPAEKLKGAE